MSTSTVQLIKLAVVAATGLSKDTLHVYVGLTAFLLAALVSREPLRSAAPWLAVLSIASLGEFIDMIDDIWSLGYWHWSASIHDVINTIFWPSVLFLIARFTRFFEASPGRA